MAPKGKILQAEWLSSTGRVLLIAVVDNRERYRVECDEEDADRLADVMWLDLEYHLRVYEPQLAPRKTRARRVRRSGALSLVHSGTDA